MSVSTALMGWRGYAAALAVGGLIAGGAAWTVRGWKADAAEWKRASEHAQERDAQAQATIAAIEEARNEGRRRTAAVEKARDDAQKQAAAAAADAAGARAKRDGLRIRANALARTAIARAPASADGSPPGASAVDLLAYMLGRVSD